jgi:hypothetical protein
MFAALSMALISFDQLCAQFAGALRGSEPQIYASIILIVLFWFLLFPPKDDSAN